MSIWWLLDRVRQKSEFLRDHRRCKRCGLYYRKDSDTCNRCRELSDEQLESIVRQRKSFRMTLGKGMILAALLICLLMLAVA